jgi:ABC-2 type transport system permease protein
VQVLLFAYAATYDVTNVAFGVWNDDSGAQSTELVRRFAASPAFHMTALLQSSAQAQDAIDSKTVAAVLHIPQDFSANLLGRRAAPVQLLLDSRRSNTALMVQGYAANIVATYTAELYPGHAPLLVLTRDWFNPTLESTWFILPGLVCILSLIMSLLISALALSRERELGTFEQLLVTPLRPAEILLGKAMPGIIVGLIDANIVIVVALLWFRVPFHGNLLIMQAMLVLYMLSGVGIGLALSALAKTQQQAMLGVFVCASPMIVLSGYAAPVENMPPAVQFIGQIDPVRYMLVATRGLFLQDLPLSVVLQQAWPMALIAAVALIVAGVAVRRAVG